MSARTFRAISREEVRAVDRNAVVALRIPSICLMENAGAGAARIALESSWDMGSGVVCVCGPGQNGGDALVVARHLAIEGFRVSVARVVPGERSAPGGDAAVQWDICRALGLPQREVADAEGLRGLEHALDGTSLVVDGLFGTGLDRPIRGLAEAVVEAVNRSAARVLALDVPSGLDCDSGLPLGVCVRATATATFVAPKLGFGNPESRRWTGDVHVVGIGAPSAWPAT